MEIKSILNKTEPGYAKWEFVLRNQMILKDSIPKKWKKNQLVCMTLFAFLVNNTKLQADEKFPIPNKSKDLKKQELTVFEQVSNNVKKDEISVAPVFIHGDGMGGGGCVSVAPAVFLSENEALEIIEQEFEKSGLALKRKNIITDAKCKIGIKKTVNDGTKNTIKTDSIETNVVLSLYNTELNLGVNFFGSQSSSIFDDINEQPYYLSAWSFDAKKAALKAREIMNNYGKINYGVFYDPSYSGDDLRIDKIINEFKKNGLVDEDKYKNDKKYMWEINSKAEKAAEEKMKEKSVELLKQQIHDFLEWYKYNSNN